MEKNYFENNSYALPSNIGKDLEIRYKDLEKLSHINHIGLDLEKGLGWREKMDKVCLAFCFLD